VSPEAPSTGASFALAGNVLTMSARGTARTIVVEDGQITDVGDEDLARAAAGRGLSIHDVGARTIVPGFVDPHIHLAHLAVGRGRGVDCRVPACRTIDQVLGALSDGLDSRSCEWLIGYGNLFFDQKIAERRTPTRDELDRVSRTVPIVLHLGGHTSVLNSAALARADLGRFTAGAAGLWGRPVVHTDARGNPTGVVGEIDRLLPVPEPAADERKRWIAKTYDELFTRHGVTAFGEMVESERTVDDLDSLIESGALRARGVLYAMVPSMLPLEPAARWAARYASLSGPSWLRAGGVKLFADGGYSARNAASRTPYAPDHAPFPGYRGRLNLTQVELTAAVRAARAHEVQLAVHTNGTRAQDEVLRTVLALGDAHDHRPIRVEHLGNVVADLSEFGSWNAANVVPVLQPGFLHNFIGDFLPMLLGDAGSRGRLPLRRMLDDGVRPAASSDVALGAEEGQSAPLFTIWSSMARRSYWDRHIEPEQAITFPEAVRLHTLEAARALGLDDVIGSVEPGKHADLVVLDRDSRGITAGNVRDVAVDEVWVGGRRVHSRNVST
jgi:predicted amidohydrolase YtcJ